MPHTRRTRFALAALTVSVALIGAGCGLDSASAQSQDRECRSAIVGQTTRDAIHAALGNPTITDHETLAGRRVVSDLWVDGTVGFSFAEASELLVEKDCD